MEKSVSVGICAHNEEETIAKLLEQIISEDILLEEVIVIVAGEDGTESVVREKSETHESISLVIEEERGGQTAAQNKIFEMNDSDLLFLIDGDGLIKEGSLEILFENFDGEEILYGREVAEIDEGLVKKMNDVIWDIHHELSKSSPKFTTQLSLIPSELVKPIPEDIVLDDEYIGVKARRKGFDIRYVPEAVKYHWTRSSLRFYFNQRRKNWAGRFQVKDRGFDNLQSTDIRVLFYLKYLLSNPLKMPMVLLTGFVEFIAYMNAYIDRRLGKWPVKWYRA